ncbi:MAG: hypothetical protein AB1896_01905, partial [Thermodesulfobacteriota bacterium]
LLGTPSEILCVNRGVWTYYFPGLVLGIPFWLPLIWAYLFCLFRRLASTLHDLFEFLPPALVKALYGLVGLVILVYSVTTMLVVIRVIALVYTAFFLPALVFWHGKKDIQVFVVAGILGTFGEYVCLKLGFWLYHYPILSPIGLPLSLPLAWGLSGVVISRLARVWEKDTPLFAGGQDDSASQEHTP